MDSMQMKRCSRCKRDRPVEEFSRDRSQRDGLNRRCRDCDRERQANPAWRARRAERQRQRLRDEGTEGPLERRRIAERLKPRGTRRKRDRAKHAAGIGSLSQIETRRRPPWQPPDEWAAIKTLYAKHKAKRKAAKGYYPWVIDHINPVDHRKRMTGGLHALANLRVVTHRANTRRGLTALDHVPMTLEQCAASVRRGHAVWSHDIDERGNVNWALYEMQSDGTVRYLGVAPTVLAPTRRTERATSPMFDHPAPPCHPAPHVPRQRGDGESPHLPRRSPWASWSQRLFAPPGGEPP